MNHKIWIDTRGLPVITTTRNGENNAVYWGWTPATARPLPTRDEIAEAIYDVLSSQYGDFCVPTDAADAVLALLKGQEA